MQKITQFSSYQINPSNANSNNLWTPELIIFTHIPKTAGTSLKQILNKNYDPKNIFLLYGDNPLKKSIKLLIDDLNVTLQNEDNKKSKNEKKIKVIGGHLGFGIHELIIPRYFTYITLLRNPIERVISYYSHVKRYFNNQLGDKARSMTLKEFVEGQVSIEVDNWQTRYLSGLGWQRFMLGTGSNIGYGQCSEEMLKQAKSNLRRYYIFGIQEEFESSLLLFSQILGWKFATNLEVNVNTKKTRKEDLDQLTINAIVKHNQLDMDLYLYAENLFKSRFF